jgi:hypothetical protein
VLDVLGYPRNEEIESCLIKYLDIFAGPVYWILNGMKLISSVSGPTGLAVRPSIVNSSIIFSFLFCIGLFSFFSNSPMLFPFSSVVEDSLVDDLFSSTPTDTETQVQPTTVEPTIVFEAPVVEKLDKHIIKIKVDLESTIKPQKKDKKNVESPERLARTLFIGNVSTEVKDKKALRACTSHSFALIHSQDYFAIGRNSRVA